MTAIDVSPYLSTDTPEVTALKEKVRSVAKKYARQHNWCGVVDAALREMGVAETKPVMRISVTLNTGMILTVEVDPRLLHELDEATQKGVVADHIGNIEVSGRGVVRAEPFTLVAEQIVGMSVAPVEPIPAALADSGWFYSSDQGRVLHYFPGLAVSRDRGHSAVYPTCGGSGTALGALTAVSSRGENRRCQRCEREHHS